MLALIIGVIAAPAFVFLVFGLALGRGPVKAAAWAQYWVWQFAMIIQRPIIHAPVDPSRRRALGPRHWHNLGGFDGPPGEHAGPGSQRLDALFGIPLALVDAP
jgi:hypothetical protein